MLVAGGAGADRDRARGQVDAEPAAVGDERRLIAGRPSDKRPEQGDAQVVLALATVAHQPRDGGRGGRRLEPRRVVRDALPEPLV